MHAYILKQHKKRERHTIAVVKFIVPEWGDKVDSGIGLWTWWYRPTQRGVCEPQAWRAGTTTLSRSHLYPPESGTMKLATGLWISLVHYQRITF
jgi:hypothetical protein